jgi:hypothetical protein
LTINWSKWRFAAAEQPCRQNASWSVGFRALEDPMPSQITCPSCGGPLRVPEELFGKRVQCPTCQAIFVAEQTGAAPPPLPRTESAGGESPRPRQPQHADDYGEYDDYGARRPRRRWLQPHRGTAILVLGILSLVVCSPLGIAAWVMGNADLQAIRRGEMDPSGEGTVQAGRICGMIGTGRLALECVLGILWMLAVGAAGAHRF